MDWLGGDKGERGDVGCVVIVVVIWLRGVIQVAGGEAGGVSIVAVPGGLAVPSSKPGTRIGMNLGWGIGRMLEQRDEPSSANVVDELLDASPVGVA
jgi:hypothetical protein